MTTTHKAHPVTRTLKTTGMACDGCEEIITEGLEALTGTGSVTADWRKNRVTVTYDLTRVRFQEVEKLLADIGYPPDDGFIQRKKRQWLHFTEQNQVDHLKHVPHCCSKPPVRAG